MKQDVLEKIDAAYRKHSLRLEKKAYDIVGDRELSKEIVNDVFVEVMKHYRWWAAQPLKLQQDYLDKTCRRISEKSLAQKKRNAGCRYRDDYQNDILSHEEKRMLGESVSAYVGKLSRSDQQVIRLKYYGYKSTDEIGKICGITRENASQRLHRARTRLKKLMDEEK